MSGWPHFLQNVWPGPFGPKSDLVSTNVYGWFTEGFDTADLRDAKMLLDELSSTSV